MLPVLTFCSCVGDTSWLWISCMCLTSIWRWLNVTWHCLQLFISASWLAVSWSARSSLFRHLNGHWEHVYSLSSAIDYNNKSNHCYRVCLVKIRLWSYHPTGKQPLSDGTIMTLLWSQVISSYREDTVMDSYNYFTKYKKFDVLKEFSIP